MFCKHGNLHQLLHVSWVKIPTQIVLAFHKHRKIHDKLLLIDDLSFLSTLIIKASINHISLTILQKR